MKMLGWMRKKLLGGSTEYQLVAPDPKFPGVVFFEEMKEKPNTLLGLQDMTENYEAETCLFPHTLLTIGTFGNSTHLHHHDMEKFDEYIEGNEEKLFEAKQSEEVLCTNTQILKSSVATVKLEPSMEELDMPVKKHVDITEEIVTSHEPLLKESKEGINEKRTTLADLFMAEPLSANAATLIEASCPQNCKTKNAKMIKKKSEILVITQSARKKLNKMIDKMTKKKIYPVMVQCDEKQNTKSRARG